MSAPAREPHFFPRANGDRPRLDRDSHRPVELKMLLQELEDRVVPTLLGQQHFPSDNPWNQNISNAPVAANSAAIIAHIGTSVPIHPDWGVDSPANGDDPLYGIPVNIVHGNSTAKVNVVIDNYPGESDVESLPIPANAVLEGDYQNGPNPYPPTPVITAHFQRVQPLGYPLTLVNWRN